MSHRYTQKTQNHSSPAESTEMIEIIMPTDWLCIYEENQSNKEW